MKAVLRFGPDLAAEPGAVLKRHVEPLLAVSGEDGAAGAAVADTGDVQEVAAIDVVGVRSDLDQVAGRDRAGVGLLDGPGE